MNTQGKQEAIKGEDREHRGGKGTQEYERFSQERRIEGEISEENQQKLYEMADIWTEGMEKLKETSRMVEEQRWEAIKTLWWGKYTAYSDDSKNAMWEIYRKSEGARQEYIFITRMAEVKGALVEERVKAAHAFTQGTVEEAKAWINLWKERGEDGWMNFLSDLTLRHRREALLGDMADQWGTTHTRSWLRGLDDGPQHTPIRVQLRTSILSTFTIY